MVTGKFEKKIQIHSMLYHKVTNGCQCNRGSINFASGWNWIYFKINSEQGTDERFSTDFFCLSVHKYLKRDNDGGVGYDPRKH